MADPRLAVVVVLPTPPLPDVIVSILLLILLLPMTPCEELLQLAQFDGPVDITSPDPLHFAEAQQPIIDLMVERALSKLSQQHAA